VPSLTSQAPVQSRTRPESHGFTRSRLVQELVGGLGSASLALGGAGVVLQLWRAHLNVPISPNGDTMLSLLLVKNMQLTGWFQGTPQLGAPFGQDLTAFPASVGDFWHLATVKVLSMFLSPAASVNVFFVLGFPMIAVVAYACLRLLRVSRPFACVLGALYALLPYHFLRGEAHLFLSAYFAVPIACVLIVSIYTGRLDLWARPRWKEPAVWVALGAAILLAGTGLYYGAFAMVMLAIAGALRTIAARGWRPVLSGGVLAAVIGVGLVLAALPNLLRVVPIGSQAAIDSRSFAETELYGLKITNLLLPVAGHRIAALAHLRVVAADTMIPGEGTETLGIIGVIGFLAVLGAVVIPRLRQQGSLARSLHPLGVMTVVALLLGTVAGFSGLLAALGFAELRAWNRISVLIAFFALAGLGHVLDAARRRWAGGRPAARRILTVGAAGAVLILGFYDQTSAWMIPNYARETATWNADAAYFTQVEQEFGTGASVFMLPYAPFPENPVEFLMPDYSHLRGYLHSNLRWSYGGVKGEESEWQPVALQDGMTAALPKLVVAGFEALYVNRTGYSDDGAQVESEIRSVIGAKAPVVNPDGTLAVYDLRPYAKSLDHSAGPLPTRASVLYPVRFEYGSGFFAAETSDGKPSRWAQSTAELTLINPSHDAANVVLRGSVRVTGNLATIRVRIGAQVTELHPVAGRAELEIPTTAQSGTTTVEFTTDAAATPSTPDDFRDLRQQLLNFTVKPAAGRN